MDGEGKGFIARKILSNTSMILELNFLAGLLLSGTSGMKFHLFGFMFFGVVAIKTLRSNENQLKATLSLLLGIVLGSVVFL